MNRSQQSRVCLTVLSAVCLLTLAAGCESEGFQDTRNKVPVVPVSGQILVDGEKYESPKMVRIVMHPDEATKEKMPSDIRSPSAWVEPDGTTFNIGSYSSDDGAPVGTYKITIEAGKMNLMNGNFIGGDLKGKYKDPATSEIEVTVTGDEGSIDLGTINVTAP